MLLSHYTHLKTINWIYVNLCPPHLSVFACQGCAVCLSNKSNKNLISPEQHNRAWVLCVMWSVKRFSSVDLKSREELLTSFVTVATRKQKTVSRHQRFFYFKPLKNVYPNIIDKIPSSFTNLFSQQFSHPRKLFGNLNAKRKLRHNLKLEAFCTTYSYICDTCKYAQAAGNIFIKSRY